MKRVEKLDRDREVQEMDRERERLELEQPRSCQQLREKHCNRMQIFEFIHQLQADNASIQSTISQQYPNQKMEEIVRQHKQLQLKREMIAIHTTSIAQLEAELDNKCRELKDLQDCNRELGGQKEQLEGQMTRMQTRSLELEKERRQLELQLSIFNEQNNQGDTSAIFQSLYQDVKNILETSI